MLQAAGRRSDVPFSMPYERAARVASLRRTMDDLKGLGRRSNRGVAPGLRIGCGSRRFA